MQGRELPECKFGSECYRKDKDHSLKYWHPSKEKELPETGNTKQTMANESGSSSSAVHCKLIVLILVGPPASGKSTFCQKVLQGAQRPWTRICQDIIAQGKRGSKVQCLKQASEALSEGQNVIIDRCNLTKGQRAEFLKLAGPQIVVHAVVLDLPAKVCIGRVAKRTAHEGGLQGGAAAAAINQMIKTKETPTLSEGFSRIMFCQTENDVENAVGTYKELGPSDDISSGTYGLNSKDGKPAGGILHFLKKEKDQPNRNSGSKSTDPSDHLSSGMYGPNSKDSKSSGGILHFLKKEKDQQNRNSGSKRTEQFHTQKMTHENFEDSDASHSSQVISCIKAPDKKTIEGSAVQNYSCNFSGVSADDSVQTLAFPSISTADFQFDHEKAANIIVENVSDFLKNYGALNMRLVLVDLSDDSDMLSRVRLKASEKGLDSKKFLTFVGDITQLYSRGGLKCNVIANAANWRLKAGGGGVNAAIFKAGGQELEVATKKQARTLSPGRALVVPLPPGSPLHKNEGVTHVIHVVGPNMNPRRPNCLAGNYVQGCKVLCDAYSSLFESFASIFRTEEMVIPECNILGCESLQIENQGGNNDQAKETKDLGTRNAFEVLMQTSKKNGEYRVEKKSKRQELVGIDSNKKCKIDNQEHLCMRDEHELQDKASHFAALKLDPSSKCLSECKERAGSTTILVKSPELSMDQEGGQNDKSTKGWGAWAQALHDMALQPERHKNTVIEFTDSVVVVPDLYPKAKKHVLVVARLDGLDSLADVRKEHLPLLRLIHSVGEKWAGSFLHEDPSMVFRLGYHLVPSMRQMHLHVISQDFDSAHLKNKKHWNSFTTTFFRDSIDVIEEVEKIGKVDVNYDKDILSMELRCHQCRSAHPNIPRLKSHIYNCKASFPASLSWGRQLISSSDKGS